MKILKFKKCIEIDKTFGDFHISTFRYSSLKNDKHKQWTEMECWHEPDCESCVLSWEHRNYEGECIDCGCYLAETSEDCPRLSVICMLPNWVKRILLKWQNKKRKYFLKTCDRKW